MANTKRHLVITGTGRAGTTFLVRLLGRLGLETGFPASTPLDPVSHAGLEPDWRSFGTSTAPHVFKCPWLCSVLDSKPECVEHVLIPVRYVQDVVGSRRRVKEDSPSTDRIGQAWHDDAEAQELDELRRLADLTVALAHHDLPHTFLWFPRLVTDAYYLAVRLSPVIGVDVDTIRKAHAAIADPSLVHSFPAPETYALTAQPAHSQLATAPPDV